MNNSSSSNATLIVGEPRPCRDCGLPVQIVCVTATGRWLVTEEFSDTDERIRLHRCGVHR